MAQPDTVSFELSVLTVGSDAKQASADNAKRVQSILDQLKPALPADAKVETKGYSIQPSRKFPDNGSGPGKITGYTVQNRIGVEMKDLERLGAVLELVTDSGADEINWVRFELSDAKEPTGEALKQAVERARNSADSIADALGMSVSSIVSVEEQGSAPPRPMMMMAQSRMEKAGGGAPPIEVGEVEIRAQVTLEVEIE